MFNQQPFLLLPPHLPFIHSHFNAAQAGNKDQKNVPAADAGKKVGGQKQNFSEPAYL